MLEWILSNLKLIVSGILVIISVIVFILQKRSVNSIDSDIFVLCIKAILLAEAGNKKGKEKLDTAVLYVCKMLEERYPKLDVGKYMTYISQVIEEILSTPSKK